MPYTPLARRKPARRTRPPFEPENAADSDALAALGRAVVAMRDTLLSQPANRAEGLLRPVLRQYGPTRGGFFPRSALIAALKAMGEPQLAAHLRLKPVRSRSGVAPVTVLTQPFPCPGRCIFCPNDVRMPKSYLSDEPGAQRAEDNGFHPYLQTFARLTAMSHLGHSVDKAELLVLGGTWSFYPESYQVWFVQRCLEALNDFGAGRDRCAAMQAERVDFSELPRAPDVGLGAGAYNRMLQPLTSRSSADKKASWAQLEATQRENIASAVRCVGLVLETRPDHIDPQEVLRLRRLGCTKVQLGVQSLRDDVLAKNDRGHDTQTTKRALATLRRFGFKCLVHWMPNLLGATPEGDIEDAARLFTDTELRPDEVKVYPCALIETAALMHDYEAGRWQPYDDATLTDVLSAALAAAPRYTRLARVIRDIPAGDIVAGTHQGNLREVAEKRVGARMQDIRAREIGRQSQTPTRLYPRRTYYVASSGLECLLEFITQADHVAAFARLRLPQSPAPIPALKGAALLRELHVYGRSLELGTRSDDATQHRGLGKALVATAKSIAQQRGYQALAVISALGTQGYYAQLGFENVSTYQRLNFS